ncbi:MAG: 3-hydroxyisobutyrate dehydrogenase [Pseudonocardiales bacterium]|nr:3-hydroxyisobutyrate dehydrogenase [Pseudonocardiales bacterium]
MRIAVLGCGEVGRLVARAAAGRYQVELCDTFPSAAAALGAELGAPWHAEIGTWLGEVDRVWACVTGDAAHLAASASAASMRPGTVYVDLTTASPDDKRAAAEVAAGYGVGYVDVAIMGTVALTGTRTPLLLAGRDAAGVAEEFATVGAPARAMVGAAGDAIALKLLRTVITKGVEALAVEACVAAERRGVRGELHRILADIDEQGFRPFLDAVVRTHVLHAERRMHEVDRAVAQLEDDGLPATVLRGAHSRFEQTVQALRQLPPEPGTSDDVDRAIAWLHGVLPAPAGTPGH